MAIFTAVRNKKQTAGTMMGVLKYVTQACKTMLDDQWMVTGHNCVARASYLEMMTTKQQFRKTDGRQFYHFVQSFPAEDGLTPQQVNAIGVEFAQKQFPDFEVVVATHLDTNHLHNHLVVNSVSCKDGKKLHQNAADLQRHRQVNDEICMAHGLQVLEPPKKHTRKKQMRPGEYQAGLRGDSWKLDLIQAINDALEYADDRESFVENMEYEGYEVIWTDTRKHITFVCPDGRRCRDSSLHDETFLKENLETLFAYRQAVGFRPNTPEPGGGLDGRTGKRAGSAGSVHRGGRRFAAAACAAGMDGEQAAASRGAEETGLGTKAEPGAELAADHVVKAMGATVVAFVESASTSIILLAFAKGYRYGVFVKQAAGSAGNAMPIQRKTDGRDNCKWRNEGHPVTAWYASVTMVAGKGVLWSDTRKTATRSSTMYPRRRKRL